MSQHDILLYCFPESKAIVVVKVIMLRVNHVDKRSAAVVVMPQNNGLSKTVLPVFLSISHL